MNDMHADADEHRLPIRFVGSGSEYFRIWVVNLLLTLVTLGLYYPYAKVRRLRYFHGATEVGGHPLSFHANPHKMLRGYLLVAVMMGGYGLASRVSPTAGLVAFVIVALLWPALWHSSLQFRLANTAWRGLRFRFTGSRGGAYSALAPGFIFAAVMVGLSASLGENDNGKAEFTPALVAVMLTPLAMMLALPWLLCRLRRYQHAHYALAGEQTAFTATVGDFYLLGLRLVGLGLLGVVVAVVASMLTLGAAAMLTSADVNRFVLTALSFLVIMAAFQLVMRPYATSRLQNLVWNGTRSAHFSFESRLKAWPLLKLTAKNWALMLVTLGLYFPFATVAMARLRLEAVQVHASTDPDTLLSDGRLQDQSAAGDAAGDMLGLDLGL